MCYTDRVFRQCEFFDDSRVWSVSRTFFHKLRTDKDVRPSGFFRDSLNGDFVKIAYRKRCI